MTKKEIKALHSEFSIHFKDSPDELQFLEAFIDDLIESRDRTFTKGYQEDLIRLNKTLNKTCGDKVKEVLLWQKEEIKKEIDKLKEQLFNSKNFTEDKEWGYSILVRLNKEINKL